jgi:serine/threonine protein kinase
MSELSGRTIDEYQLIDTIDEGGAALVYRGFQPSMNRYVAIKVLKPHAARDVATVQRFRQSAELTAQMQHPNILPVYDIGQTEGTIYRVSALAEGGTLRDDLAWFQDTTQAVEIMKQLTAALEYIHARGYVHGNLKSTNVLLDAQRRPLICDFGLVQLVGGAPTPYMSPEQVQGGAVDQRSDVYALGVLLYEMLVGEPPPPGVVASLRGRRPDLPVAIERVVLKAMAQNPDLRFQSAAEFQNALEMAIAPPVQPPAPKLEPAPAPATTATPAPTVSQSVQLEQPKGTNWAAIILGVLVVGLLGLALILILPRLGNGEEAQPTPPPPETTTEMPTQPPVEVTVEMPTQPPVEQPTQESPPDQPTAEAPEQLPEGPDDSGGGLPGICGSIPLTGGLVALGGVFAARRRREDLTG